jgi:ribosomal protein S18 acetylase RimI-like enzyme
MEIRDVKSSDIAGVMELSRQIGALHFEHAPEVFAPPSMAERRFYLDLIESSSGLFKVAVTQDRVVGFITARIDINETVPFIVKAPICRIGTIVVDENHHSCGVGKALMLVADNWAQAHNVSQTRLEVMSFNTKARKFYQSLGFNLQSEIWAK